MRSKYFGPDQPLWSFSQQIALRLTVATKFFVIARLLGPDAIGRVAAAVLIAAIAEALSDVGLNQAAIYQKSNPSREIFGGILTISFLRGLVIASGLYLMASHLSIFVGVAASVGLIQLAALQFLARGLLNPAYYSLSRQRNFRVLFVVEASCSITDLCLSIGLALVFNEPGAIILGGIASDSLRSLISWALFHRDIAIGQGISRASNLAAYGKWIWLAGVAVACINQADKFIVGRWVGSVGLGEYQTAFRLAQLVTVDAISGLCAYLFPTLARLFHEDANAARTIYLSILRRSVILLVIVGLALYLLGPTIISAVLGSDWQNLQGMLLFCIPAALIGSLLTLQATYLRSVGSVRIIFVSMIFQFFTLIGAAALLVGEFGAKGMAASSAIAGVVALVAMFYLHEQSNARSQ